MNPVKRQKKRLQGAPLLELWSVAASSRRKGQLPKATQATKTATSPTSRTSAGLKEMDEYSGYDSSHKDEAALVHCLKFYACGIVADKVNLAIQAGDD